MARYLADKNTKEIHDLYKSQVDCQIDEIKPEHRIMIDSIGEVLRYIREYEYNGCKWCLAQYHTD